jgi:hypothetical protein
MREEREIKKERHNLRDCYHKKHYLRTLLDASILILIYTIRKYDQIIQFLLQVLRIVLQLTRFHYRFVQIGYTAGIGSRNTIL